MIIDKIKYGRFSLEERLSIEALIRLQRSFTYISRFLKRTKEHITLEVQRNGGRYSYNHKKAHLNEDTAKNGGIDNKNKSQIIGKDLPKPPDQSLAEAKIAAIEDSIQLIYEQISILFDTIKELKK